MNIKFEKSVTLYNSSEQLFYTKNACEKGRIGGTKKD